MGTLSKPLPDGMYQGQSIGLWVDTQDHVWIVHRPDVLDEVEGAADKQTAECCKIAPPILEFADLRLDPFRREAYRDGRYVKLTRKQFSVLEVLMTAKGGVISAETLLERAWDENADPFSNTVRITISTLRKRLGDPWVIHTVPGVGYRIGDS